MGQINSEILRQFEAQGLTINKGISLAVGARLVKSAIRPLSNDEIKKKVNHCCPNKRL